MLTEYTLSPEENNFPTHTHHHSTTQQGRSMTRAIVSKTAMTLGRTLCGRRALAFPTKLASSTHCRLRMQQQQTSSTTTAGGSVFTGNTIRRLTTFAPQHRTTFLPTIPTITRAFTTISSPSSSSTISSTASKGDTTTTSTHHYTALSTPASIAKAHFDLTNIPVNEHAQILRDFILVPDYLSLEEHDMMVREATRKLKRALGKQLRYEDGHFDGVITRYRECSAGDWALPSNPLSSDTPSLAESPTSEPGSTTRKERTTPHEMITSLKQEFFPHSWTWVSPHILELEAGQGGIKPHVDHLDASGSVVAGLCLASSAVMELIHQDDPEKRFRVLLPKRCFYFQRDSVRYSYMHGIPIEEEDHSFRGVVVKKEKRISIMLRNALDPSLQNNRPTSTTTMS